MNKRLITLVAVAAGLALLACSASQLAPRPIARATATPVRTLRPTFTPTNTPTSTDVPTATPIPTNTASPTPRPTDTPPPTDTPLPTNTLPPSPTSPPTDTPPPTIPPTATRRPTPRPPSPPTATRPPRPTNTPAPAFTANVVRGFARCDGYRGVEGQVKHASGSGFGGVSIGVWSDTWVGIVTQSEPDGKYAFNLSNLPPGTFKLAVVRPESCAMQDVLTAFQCTYLSTPKEIAITENCTGAGASQVTVLDFTGP